MVFNREKDGKEIIQLLYEQGMIETWFKRNPKGYILKAKIWSPFYINIRPCGSKTASREILAKIGLALGGLIKDELPHITKVVGLYIAGMPLATSITMSTGIPSCYGRNFENVNNVADFYEKLPTLRRQLREHGDHSLVEGDFCDGDKIAIVDDLATKFSTKLLARAQITEAAKDKNAKVCCDDVVVLIDREQGAKETAAKNGMTLSSLISFKSQGIHWLQNKMDPIEYETIVDYLEDNEKYQDGEIQEKLRQIALNHGNASY